MRVCVAPPSHRHTQTHTVRVFVCVFVCGGISVSELLIQADGRDLQPRLSRRNRDRVCVRASLSS